MIHGLFCCMSVSQLDISRKYWVKPSAISLVYAYLFMIIHEDTALVVKNIEASFVFLTRLCVSLWSIMKILHSL